MTDKNTAATNTAAKAAAAGTKPVATPKKEDAETSDIVSTNRKSLEQYRLDLYGKEMIEELDKRTKAIKTNIGKIDRSFDSIAFDLYWIYSKEAYKAKGADSIAKYASDMFGYEKTTCYSLIAIVERFAKRDENGNLLEEFDPKYKGYSSSKLSLMTGLTDEQIEGLNPDMSVRDIKKYVASLKEKPLPSPPDGNSGEKTGGEDSIGLSKNGYYSRNLFLIYGFDDYNDKIDKIDNTIHKLYEEMPNAKIRIEVDSEEPINEKWGDYTVPVKNDKWG